MARRHRRLDGSRGQSAVVVATFRSPGHPSPPLPFPLAPPVPVVLFPSSPLFLSSISFSSGFSVSQTATLSSSVYAAFLLILLLPRLCSLHASGRSAKEGKGLPKLAPVLSGTLGLWPQAMQAGIQTERGKRSTRPFRTDATFSSETVTTFVYCGENENKRKDERNEETGTTTVRLVAVTFSLGAFVSM